MKKILKRILYFFVVFSLFINLWVFYSTKNLIVSENNTSEKPLIVVFGAGIQNNKPSDFLKARLDQAIFLYRQNRDSKILLSGDDGGDETDEISVMMTYCLANNVAKKDIFIDYKGYTTRQTLDNVYKEHKSNNIILVTHQYHLYRALYIAKKLDLKIVGVAANQNNNVSAKYYLREYLANVKAFFILI